ncbi:MAG TPA: bifunctional [glutamine synthetase] adenylyltransferase/[glutamine synthetase]-adenylyl-L-tyrosine phosphorylase [Streptosporangiaceae bacterium]|jgi:glutamate-ammonia-ligase adenylyltransferase
MARGTLTGQLAALGFADTERARQLLTADLGLDPDGNDAWLVEALATAAEPDLALATLARLAPDAELTAALKSDPGLRDRLITVLGVSAALGDHLVRHPADWRVLAGPGALARPSAAELRAGLLKAVGADPDAAAPAADAARIGGRDPATELRPAYRRRLLHLAARDLTGADPLGLVMAELADLATAALSAALAIARAGLPPGAAPGALAVIAMGKGGGRELNYASDFDVIFVAAPPEPGGPGGADAEAAALRTATALAGGMIRVCSQSTAEGALFPVDPNLRPEGRSGPLVRTVASHRAYYERWAKTWEFQALLKARLAAGDAGLGAEYLAAVSPMVWQAAQRPDFVADVQAMRRRVLGSLPADEAGRELKLGPGGLRDIEFAVQLLQLVHGRTDESLRVAGTLEALAALAAGGYVGRADAASLASAYAFLRRVEHLLQLRQLRRTHTLPEDRAILRQVGRALRRMRPGPDGPGPEGGSAGADGAGGPHRADPAAELLEHWRRHAGQARQLHEKLFYRPLLDAVARLPGEAVRLTPAAAVARLQALGYADPAGALRHIEALSSGVSRKAAIQRTLLPVLLGWFADAPLPDAGLLAFRQVSEALGDSPWYLRLLRDNTLVAQRMARVLASSRYATGLLLRAPEAVAMLADTDELALRPAEPLLAEALAAVGRHPEAQDAVRAVLAIRRREVLRTAMAWVLGLASAQDRGEALTVVAGVTVAAALEAAVAEAEQASGAPLPTRMAVIAMGRFGGREMGFASDADVMFVHDPLPGVAEEAASRAAQTVAERLRALLARSGPDPALQIDAGLRPEGRQGPLVRTLASYRAYYRRWSVPWEAQALLRAAVVAGDAGLGAAFIAMADEIRYPDGGIAEDSVREIRRIKARVEAERMPRGKDPALNVKLGPGGLTDVEWVAQLLQLRHAYAVPGLRTTATLAALAAASAAGLVSAADAAVLTGAWQLAARIRDGVMLMRGRGSDALPSAAAELAIVARLLGYPPDSAQQLAEDWRRASRHARAATERLFYG